MKADRRKDPRHGLTATKPPSSRRGRRRWLRRLATVYILLLLAFSLVMIDLWSTFGTKANGARLERMQHSAQYADGRFVNPLPALSQGASWSVLKELFFGDDRYRVPSEPVPVAPRTADDFAGPAADLRVTWLGHATLLVEIEGVRLLTDPVWSDHASPGPLFGVKRFYAPPLSLEALPPIDAVVISHDHYDHLDAPTVKALAERVPRFIVPLGVGAHLEYWGVAPERIVELEWWEHTEVAGVEVHCTPARHFSGRFLNDRNATLWASWAFIGAHHRAFFSGDSALFPGFEEIGTRLGPFDVAMMEIGAYNASWADVHMGPEQAVVAHQMVRGGLMLPVHWGTFKLALHTWTEPAERARVAAEQAGVPIAFPRPGESITPETPPAVEPWWPALPWQTAEEAPIISSGMPAPVVELSPGSSGL